MECINCKTILTGKQEKYCSYNCNMKDYYKKNKEKIKDKENKWRKENPKEKKKRDHEYYVKNKEKIKNKTKDYFNNNKKTRLKKQKEYYQKNKEQILEQQQTYLRKHLYPTKPYLDKTGYYRLRAEGRFWLEHDYIWYLYNGDIPKGYVIHHKNQIRTDNRISNLQLMSRSEHIALHHRLRSEQNV